jgi:Sulfotransferase family
MKDIPKRVSQKVCFIAGAGHSGSTLLGFILGSHTDGFYCGEAAKTKYLQDDTKKLSKRVCKICGTECPIWGSFSVNSATDLYEQVAATVHKPLIVDSSKSIEWLEYQISRLEQTSTRPFLIFLQRDGRAVINSRIRKYPNKQAVDLIEAWSKQIYLTNLLFDTFPYKKLKVQYEELATHPERVVSRICDFDYQPAMLDYDRHEHHVLGGNNGTQFLVAQAQQEKIKAPFVSVPERSKNYYESHGSGITLDLRWKQELDPAIVRLFEEMAGKENQEMKWDV